MNQEDMRKKHMALTLIVCNAAINLAQTFGQLGISRIGTFDGFVDAAIGVILTKEEPEKVAQRLYERADKLVAPSGITEEPIKGEGK